jgi:hypothetical protein
LKRPRILDELFAQVSEDAPEHAMGERTQPPAWPPIGPPRQYGCHNFCLNVQSTAACAGVAVVAWMLLGVSVIRPASRRAVTTDE